MNKILHPAAHFSFHICKETNVNASADDADFDDSIKTITKAYQIVFIQFEDSFMRDSIIAGSRIFYHCELFTQTSSVI